MKKIGQIFRLSELSEETKTAAIKVINNLKHYQFHDFNEYGLKFTADFLKFVGGSIIMSPLEYMAEYVDEVTKNLVDINDKDFISLIISMKDDGCYSRDYANYNATSIGNLAYVTLKSSSKEAQEISIQLLQNYSDYYYSPINQENKKP